MIDFFSYPRLELARELSEKFGERAFRSTQLFQWVYKHSVTDLSAMTDLSQQFREKSTSIIEFPKAAIVDRQISSDGTRKYLVGLDKGAQVETVMIKQPNRMTLCVSSQIGCGMACTFCRTGTMGFIRNLSASEIIRQVMLVIEDAKNFGDMFSNIVFMGMGEPLHNLSSVLDAIKILTDPQGLNISPRKITVSTSGLVPAIEKFGAATTANLAVSLNATTDEVRTEIMPVNKSFPLAVLLETLRRYPLGRRKKITIEYVMLHTLNDTKADLERLPKLLRGISAKVNLIPYNDNTGLGYQSPPREWVFEWQKSLHQRGVDVTTRWSKGQDISAACGQLATSAKKQPLNRVATHKALQIITEAVTPN